MLEETPTLRWRNAMAARIKLTDSGWSIYVHSDELWTVIYVRQ